MLRSVAPAQAGMTMMKWAKRWKQKRQRNALPFSDQEKPRISDRR
jgi:hypothetical protein